MDFWDLTKLLFRRWYFALPMLAVTAAVALVIQTSVKPDYVATSYVQLIPAPAGTTQDTTASSSNPWINLGIYALSVAAMITVRDQSVVEELEQGGYTSSYTIGPEGSGTIIKIEVVAANPKEATDTTREVARVFDEAVRNLQVKEGAKTTELITTRRLDLGDNLVENTSKMKRALIAVGAVGVLISGAFTLTLDALLRRRARRSGRLPEMIGAQVMRPRGALAAPGAISPDERATAAGIQIRNGVRAVALNEVNRPSVDAGQSGIDHRPNYAAAGGSGPDAARDEDGAAKPANPADVTIVLPLSGMRGPRRPGDRQ